MILGNTGKTVFFQSQIEDPEINGLYWRVTEGVESVERLSAKLRKKINERLEIPMGKGYPKTIWPKTIWINFGRTVEVFLTSQNKF